MYLRLLPRVILGQIFFEGDNNAFLDPTNGANGVCRESTSEGCSTFSIQSSWCTIFLKKRKRVTTPTPTPPTTTTEK